MVSISGVRGIIGESLSPDVVVKYAAAFAQYCNRGPIVIGRDGRITGKIIANIVSSTLLSMGCDVTAIGVAPTPTIGLAVESLQAAGGIAVTASHNPMEWNGMKFIGRSGMFLNKSESEQFWAIAETQRLLYSQWNTIGRHVADTSMLEQHVKKALQIPSVNVETIRRRKFKVVVDCINAAGGAIVPRMLRDLGCEVVELNCDQSGIFARPPEPVPENLQDLCRRVTQERADLGIAVDPDVDRLVFITEQGMPFGEEYTVTTAARFVLRHLPKSERRRAVVVNLSTTRAVDDVAKEYGASVYRTAVGEINVATKMKEVNAVVGGEGSGGVIIPALHYSRDAIAGIAVILQELAEFGGPLSAFKASLPQYVIMKSKIDIAGLDPDTLLDRVRQRHATNGNVNTDDGLKIDLPDGWVHLRKSNTEPIIRIIAEAATVERSTSLVTEFKKELA